MKDYAPMLHASRALVFLLAAIKICFTLRNVFCTFPASTEEEKRNRAKKKELKRIFKNVLSIKENQKLCGNHIMTSSKSLSCWEMKLAKLFLGFSYD